jgi:hypothetical protein
MYKTEGRSFAPHNFAKFQKASAIASTTKDMSTTMTTKSICKYWKDEYMASRITN